MGPFLCPNVNSLPPFKPECFLRALCATWGIDNRTVRMSAFRGGDPESMAVSSHRLAGADAKPVSFFDAPLCCRPISLRHQQQDRNAGNDRAMPLRQARGVPEPTKPWRDALCARWKTLAVMKEYIARSIWTSLLLCKESEQRSSSGLSRSLSICGIAYRLIR